LAGGVNLRDWVKTDGLDRQRAEWLATRIDVALHPLADGLSNR
jgi:hypothetical protein